jgi:hypothetical protein
MSGKLGEKSVNRRAFLLSTAGLTGLLGIVAGSRAAAAFSIENYGPHSKLALAIANRCSEDGLHAQILAKLNAKLASETGTLGQTLTLTEYCPFCGCPIIATRTVD